jgi:hypothetical protein
MHEYSQWFLKEKKSSLPKRETHHTVEVTGGRFQGKQ